VGSGEILNTFTIGEALGYGWKGLWKNLGPLIIVGLAAVGIQLVFAAVASQVDATFLKAVLSFVGSIIAIMIVLGWIRVGLAITRGEPIELGSVFTFDGWLRYAIASILFNLGVYIGFILLVIPGIIFATVFGFYGWLIVDKDAGIGDSFSRSAEITKGNRWNIFALSIVLLLMNIVGLVLLVVGVLFTAAISLVSLAYVYRVISGEQPVALD
jgi:uncharacterized membrane protein